MNMKTESKTKVADGDLKTAVEITQPETSAQFAGAPDTAAFHAEWGRTLPPEQIRAGRTAKTYPPHCFDHDNRLAAWSPRTLNRLIGGKLDEEKKLAEPILRSDEDEFQQIVSECEKWSQAEAAKAVSRR